jgi:FkbM family methyltransferase
MAFLDLYSRLFARKKFHRFNKYLFYAGARGLGILNYKNEYQTGEGPFLKNFLSQYDRDKGYVIIDVGANQGQFASWALDQTSNISVISFEPDPSSCKKLKMNLQRYQSRYTLIEMAASSHEGFATLYDRNDSTIGRGFATLGRGVLEYIFQAETTETAVQLTTIDNVVSRLKPKVCLLKIDTEGHEYKALLGAKNLLNEAPPSAILVEFNEMNAVTGVHFYSIMSLLKNSYEPFRLLPGGELLPIKNDPPLLQEIYAFQNLVFLKKG